MPTAFDLISMSLKTINAYAPGEDISAADAADSLYLLNEMLDSWSVDGFYMFQTISNSFNSVVGQSIYTVGTGGNFNMVRPTKINNVNFIYAGVTFSVMSVTGDEFDNIPVKSSLGIPFEYNYEPNMPMGMLSLYPTPSVVGSVVLQTNVPLTQFSGLNTNVDLPPGYQEAIKMALAIKLCDPWSKTITPSMQINHNKALKRIKRNNVVVPILEIDVPAYVSSGESNGLNG